jgi:hypothetical protein
MSKLRLRKSSAVAAPDALQLLSSLTINSFAGFSAFYNKAACCLQTRLRILS